jgi:hypothetical protein
MSMASFITGQCYNWEFHLVVCFPTPAATLLTKEAAVEDLYRTIRETLAPITSESEAFQGAAPLMPIHPALTTPPSS